MLAPGETKNPFRAPDAERVLQACQFSLLIDGFENIVMFANNLRLSGQFHKRHADARTEKLQRDFLAVFEFDAIAIGAMLEPREDNLFAGLDA